MIALVTLVVGLFNDTVEIYERNNNGGWYDFGFLIGVLCIWGGGSKAKSGRARSRRDAEEWEAVARRVEDKIKRRIREWAEAEPDEAWNVVEEKAEAKLKQRTAGVGRKGLSAAFPFSPLRCGRNCQVRDEVYRSRC